VDPGLVIREAGLGSDHPDVATSLNNLGLVLADLGNLNAARTHHERALAIRLAGLGPDHPT
jgi:Flp pilus assembly protein TadD